MKKKLLALMMIVLLCTTFSPGALLVKGQEQNNKADTVFENGKIYTVDEENSWAEAIAIKDGIFVYVGDNEGVESYKGANTEVIDLKGQMMSPGFIDGHLHAYLKAEELFWLDLSKYKTYEEYVVAIKDYKEKNPNMEQLRATGWSEAVTQEQSKATGLTHRQLLDQLVTDIPVVVISGGHHELWVNSKAFEIAGVDASTPNPAGGNIDRDAKGEPTGILREPASHGLIIDALPQPDFTVEEFKEALLAFQTEAAQNGVTGAFVPITYTTVSLLQAFEELDNEGKLTLTYDLGLWLDETKGPEQVAGIVETGKKYKGENYTINAVKIFVTGDTHDENLTATGDTGLIWDQDNLNKNVAELDKQGFRVHAHSNGDGQGVQAFLEALEYAADQNGEINSRHAITHIPIVTEADIERFKKLNTVLVPQPSWFFRSKGLTLEDPRLPNLNRMKSYFDAGLTVASSSDYPVVSFSPLNGVEGGITRLLPTETDLTKVLWPKESVTLEQMMTSYTINSAYQIDADDKTGSIELGKQADFVVLENNLFEIPVTQISETKFMMTYFKGKELYRDASLVDASYLTKLVKKFSQEKAFSNNGVSQSLQAQLATVIRFEERKDAEKVIMHTEKFKETLAKFKNTDKVSVSAYTALTEQADVLIKKWK